MFFFAENWHLLKKYFCMWPKNILILLNPYNYSYNYNYLFIYLFINKNKKNIGVIRLYY